MVDDLAEDGADTSVWSRLRRLVRDDTAGFHVGLLVAHVLTAPLRNGSCNRLRAAALRCSGFHLGPGTVVLQVPRINGERRLLRNLRVGAGCRIELGCTFELLEPITIGDGVTIGERALILTSSHEIGPKEHRAGDAVRGPVDIGERADIGPGAIILHGVSIGAGASVGPGSLVNKNVPPGVRVEGVPAKAVAAAGHAH